MAVIFEWDENAKREWHDWLFTRPDCIKSMAAKCPPNRLYRMKSTSQRCTIIAYSEDGTVRVNITGQYNFVIHSRQVYGVAIDDLEECDPPGPDEQLGDFSEMLAALGEPNS